MFENVTFTAYKAPDYKWKVNIPKGGDFCVHYEKLTLRQRIGFRFLGWEVVKLT